VSDALDGLDSHLRSLAANDELSGVVLFRRGARTVFEAAYGWASRAWRVPMDLDMRFDCASVTKLFTAVATLQRVDAGDFALDTSAIDYLALEGTAISPAVTVRHLLTHTSGIADDADEEAGERYEDLFVEKANYSEIETADHLADFAFKPPNFAPGEGCRYCNAGFLLLGLMVEKATRESYRDYVRREVFAAAGMTRSGFFRMDEVVAEVAEPCEPMRDESGAVVGWKRNIFSYPPIGSPDGGAHVTAGDLVRFVQALRDHTLIPSPLAEQMVAPQVEWYRSPRTGAMHMNGFGCRMQVDDAGDVVWWGKEGINVGVSAEVAYYPRHDVTTVVLCSSEQGAWGPIEMIEELVLSGALDNQ
jgi:CubicO group peptidase (beta-lactamase class C family)